MKVKTEQINPLVQYLREAKLSTDIILPGRKHEDHEYPDLLVSMELEQLGRTQEQACKAVRTETSFVPCLRYGVDLRQHLTSGKPVYNGAGKKLSRQVVKALSDEMSKVRLNWRGEFFNDRYLAEGNKFYVIRDIVKDGKLIEVKQELEDCLMEDRTPGISLEDLFKKATYQGLPRKNVNKGNLWYWYPRNGSFARFGAVSGRAVLYCSGDPRGSYPELGVSQAKIFSG